MTVLFAQKVWPYALNSKGSARFNILYLHSHVSRPCIGPTHIKCMILNMCSSFCPHNTFISNYSSGIQLVIECRLWEHHIDHHFYTGERKRTQKLSDLPLVVFPTVLAWIRERNPCSNRFCKATCQIPFSEGLHAHRYIEGLGKPCRKEICLTLFNSAFAKFISPWGFFLNHVTSVNISGKTLWKMMVCSNHKEEHSTQTNNKSN